MYTSTYRRQHTKLLEQVAELKDIFEQKEFSKRESEIIQKLSELSGLLKLHLKLEDENLYPALLAHKNQAVKEMAARYVREMSGLSEAFTNYRTKWLHLGAITAEPQKFVEESINVFSALGTRIDKENNELYSLVDNLLIVVTPSASTLDN
jgi:hemerythrin-like domain-containing protein